jgi:murein DD-endopeptidase MepM/ murein hydrolase activator NlpD
VLALPAPTFVDAYREEEVTYRWPAAGVVTSRFGDLRPGGRRHQGVDIANAVGTPIFAAAAGEVVFSGWQSGYGNLVVLGHSNGEETYYAHNSVNRVRIGQWVGRGQWIADMGSTGFSTGPHLHFEIRRPRAGQLVAIDPLVSFGSALANRP